MTTRKLTTIALVVLLAWLAGGSGSTVTGATATDAFNANANSYGDSLAQGTISTVVGSETDATTLPASVSADWWATARENLRQAEYHITWQEQTYLSDLPASSAELRAGAYQAPNRAHNLRTYFTPAGIHVIPRTESETSWEWGLTLTGYGYTGNVQPVAPAELVATGNRIEYWRSNLTEWYVNDEHGLEQGFTLEAPPLPVRASPLTGRLRTGPGSEGHNLILDLALSGDLTPVLTDGGTAIEFTTPPSTDSGQGGGVHVLRYADLRAYDATGRALPAHMSFVPLNNASRFTSHALRLTIDDSYATYPITIDPLTTSPNWTAENDQAFAEFGYSVGAAGDVNGDGYADVIVGAPSYDNGQAMEGRAFVYHGSATGLSTTADWTAESDQAGARFGNSVGTAGDVNGDGYADVIVGAEWYQNYQGRVYVYHGSAAGLSATADWTAESDQAGYFGYSVGTAGDVNGDGYADTIVGAYGLDRAYVYHGSAAGLSTTADWTAESDQAGARLGISVGTAGDVNGDGYADVIVGTLAEVAYVYYGSGTGLSATANWAAEGDQAGANFGRAIGTAGDVNGDGYADVIVGASGYDLAAGRAFVYHGSAAGLSTSAVWTAGSNQYDAGFGNAVGTAGDVNSDGFADVIVGAAWYGEMAWGAAFVYHGSAAGLSATADWMVEGDQAAPADFGWSVSTAGDVNGDGYADVIVGAPWPWGGEGGAAFVYHGEALNRPPDCSGAEPSVETIWPPNHKFVSVDVLGVTDPEGDAIVITIDSIFQDEPLDTYGDGSFTPDGLGVGTSTAEVRAERAGTKTVPDNGRVYHIFFTADDGHGGSCTGEVLIGVPHDVKDTPVDDGALYDSTALAPWLVVANGPATLESTLWHGNTTDWGGAGTIVTGTHNYIDGDPLDSAPDLGADERAGTGIYLPIIMKNASP